MRRPAPPEPVVVHSMATAFPTVLLALTPALDVVRLVTRNPWWTRAALLSSLLAAAAVLVAVLPQVVDWLALDRGSPARRAGAAPLLAHLAAVWPVALGTVERLHSAAPLAGAFAWPFALAVAGAVAWLAGDWMAGRGGDRVRYQPIGLPASA